MASHTRRLRVSARLHSRRLRALGVGMAAGLGSALLTPAQALAAPLIELSAAAAPALPAAKPAEKPADDGHWFGPFKNQITLGFAGRSSPTGTNTNDWNAQFSSRSDNPRHRLQTEIGWFYSEQNNNTSRSVGFLKATHDWKLPDSALSIFARIESAFDRFSSYETRVAAYGGVAYDFVKNAAWEVTGRLGLGERYDFGDVDGLTPEAIFGGSALGWKIGPRQKLAAELLAYPSLDGSGNWRGSGKCEWSIGLSDSQKTSLRLGARDEYDTNRKAGQRDHDVYYYMGIGFDL